MTIEIPVWLLWVFVAYCSVAIPLEIYQAYLKFKLLKLQRNQQEQQ